MVSPTVVSVFVTSHLITSYLPAVPNFSLETELPLSMLDAATRSMLVCDFALSLVKRSPYPEARYSPVAPLVTSLILGNGGFFIANACSMLSPDGWKLTTPPELAYMGWTSLDLGNAPFATMIYATLTHAQPFWAQIHFVLAVNMYGPGVKAVEKKYASPESAPAPGSLNLAAWSTDEARAACFMVMLVLFSARAWNNYKSTPEVKAEKKIKEQ